MSEARPKRVLLTGDTVGGVWTFVTELARCLLSRHIEVFFAAIGPAITQAQIRAANSIPGLEWEHCSAELEWMENPWQDVARTGRWLLSKATQFNPDLVHLNTLSYGDCDFGAPVVQTVHSCVCSWWEAVKQEPLPSQYQPYHDHVQKSLCAADRITAPSFAMLSNTAKHYDLDNSKSQVIHNGLDPSLVQPVAKEPIVLGAGRLWDHAKNLTALADIAARLPWPVYLAGNPVSPSGALTFFSNCTLLGELDRYSLLRWYKRASIFVLPAKYEPFGFSALEAALSGCALILGDIPSLREIWQDSAVFVPPDDHEALRLAIEQFVFYPQYLIQMAERSAQRARSFSSERMTASYLDSYQVAQMSSRRSMSCVS